MTAGNNRSPFSLHFGLGLAVGVMAAACSANPGSSNRLGTTPDQTAQGAGVPPSTAAGTGGTPAAGTGGAMAGDSAGGAGGGAVTGGADGFAGPDAGTNGAAGAGSRSDASVPPGNPGDAAVTGQGDAAAAVDAGQSGPALWIAPDGDDANPGTESAPLRGLAAAHDRATAGTTIWVKAGTYAFDKTVNLQKTGGEQSPFNLFAAPGARPVFDFSEEPRDTSSARGLELSGQYWHLRGLELENAGDNCVHISGSHNTVEQVVIHGCDDTGLQITADGSEASDPTRAAHNTVLNCDSYENYDAANGGENADGFAAKLHIGAGNVFRGCRAWHNADDGWDLFAADDVVVIDHCWAIENGKISSTQSNPNGDGNGFKLGGAPALGDPNEGGAVHMVTDCASISNLACGFVRNNNPDVPQLSMCGGQGNGKGTFCSLSSTGALTVTMSASAAIAAQRNADGSLPDVH